jgi:uncharacterized protein YjbJ (UPF0337 family)
MAVDSNRIEGSWAELKGKAKQQWGNLTDSELTQIGGKKDELIGRIQARYGYSKDRAQQEVESWLESMGQSSENTMARMYAATDGAKQVADNFAAALQKSIDKNPTTTLAMVAAVAFVIGAIWKS